MAGLLNDALLALPIRQYPRTENAVVTVTTLYYGADPDVVAGFITQPMEAAIAQAGRGGFADEESSEDVAGGDTERAFPSAGAPGMED